MVKPIVQAIKRTSCLVLLASLAFSCQKPVKKTGKFALLPVPQEMNITGTSDFDCANVDLVYNASGRELPVLDHQLKSLEETGDPAKADIVVRIDTMLALKPEGYTLTIGQERISIAGKDQNGLFYGLMSLSQLLEDACEQSVNLPLVQITDFPELAYRAVHLDVKHHLEKTDYYYDLIDRLARYKINGIIAEMEDKLRYQRQPLVASSDALSIAEWKQISSYAEARFIDFSPLIQGLGHASFVLKHPEYHHLRDSPESDWAFNPLDPETYEVQFDLYRDALEATPDGKYLHVGGDEVHTTGRNSGKSALELQLLWLGKVSDFAAKHQRIPIFWDDMPLKQADVYRPMFQPELSQKEVDSIWQLNEHKLSAFLDLFPKNCIYMRWNYSAPESIGNTKAMEWFRSHGLQVMGATAGQTRWTLMPQKESNMEAIKTFAMNAIESGTNGLLLTLWDDDSPHFELYKRGIIAFSEYTWSGEKRSKEHIKAAYRQREFGHTLTDTAYAFIDELEKPVAFWKNALLKGDRRNYLAAMEHPIEEGVIDLPDPNNRGQWAEKYQQRLITAEQLAKRTDSITRKINEMKARTVRNVYTLDIYEQVNAVAGFSPRALLALREFDQADNPTKKREAIQKLRELEEEFRAIREHLETTYAKVRILTKPEGYLLDQDHHHHMANQSVNFDWQFLAESLFFEKLSKHLENAMYIENADPLSK